MTHSVTLITTMTAALGSALILGFIAALVAFALWLLRRGIGLKT